MFQKTWVIRDIRSVINFKPKKLWTHLERGFQFLRSPKLGLPRETDSADLVWILVAWILQAESSKLVVRNTAHKKRDGRGFNWVYLQ
jgi:hypothetical protein